MNKNNILGYLFFCALSLIILIAILHDSPLSETAKFTKPATLEIIREYPLGIKIIDKINVVSYQKDVIRKYRKAQSKSYYHVLLVIDNKHKEHLLFLTPFCIKKTEDAFCEELETEYNNLNKFFNSDMQEYVVNSNADALYALIGLYFVGAAFLYFNLRIFIFK
ncbi:MAG: hypothetical protein K6A44_03560 [bacterium]|nr:hypothetical protein [bacterium]